MDLEDQFNLSYIASEVEEVFKYRSYKLRDAIVYVLTSDNFFDGYDSLSAEDKKKLIKLVGHEYVNKFV